MKGGKGTRTIKNLSEIRVVKTGAHLESQAVPAGLRGLQGLHLAGGTGPGDVGLPCRVDTHHCRGRGISLPHCQSLADF